MKLNSLTVLFSGVFILFAAFSSFAQISTFKDSNVEYTFDLPEQAWKMTAKPSETNPDVEYVYGDRQNGYLEVRKASLKSGDRLSDLISDEEQKLQFLTGFVAGKQEDFGGTFDGKVYNYEFVRSGRNMSGRFYFLKTDDKTVYILRFTGQRDKLRAIRNQTDSIARTFNLKKGK